ncbi:hypothetical protein EK21DRAFT_95101 [Setomelanomma holmii]|uniref:Uncharacterized protein n=1 Tax=Setomelanomma holmii TaxID=210430 RepID=A0A9P4GUM3_9PLEO|nr:hypothetical protein EK21DRAFT_95101 [Setomelanomma holmii]
MAYDNQGKKCVFESKCCCSTNWTLTYWRILNLTVAVESTRSSMANLQFNDQLALTTTSLRLNGGMRSTHVLEGTYTMSYQIDLFVLSHSFYKTDFYVHVHKHPDSRLAAICRFLSDPSGFDEDTYVLSAKRVVRTALLGYDTEKSFRVMLSKSDGMCMAELYLEQGRCLIERGKEKSYDVALEILRDRVGKKVKCMKAEQRQMTQ